MSRAPGVLEAHHDAPIGRWRNLPRNILHGCGSGLVVRACEIGFRRGVHVEHELEFRDHPRGE